MSEDDKHRIEIAIPNRSSSSQINASLAKTLQSLDSPDTEKNYEVSVSFSYLQPVDANRNEMVKNFLNNPDNEWLLMIDNDIVPPVDILSMVEHGEKVVSGVCTIKKDKVPQPVIVKEDESRTNYRQVNLSEYQDEVREDGLLEVEGIGTGCLLIHRSVLEEMKPPWFRFEYNEYGGLALGEDFYFSRRLRENDVPMYVDTNMVCSHYKKTDLTEFATVVADLQDAADSE